MNIFEFKDLVPLADQEKLRNFLHKISFNINNAYMYLSVAGYLYETLEKMKKGEKRSGVHTIYLMAIISLMISIRRIFDKSGKRSLRELVLGYTKSPAKQTWKAKIDKIYSNYDKFLNKALVHQDEHSMKGVLNFPNSDEIHKHLDFAAMVYERISQEVCKADKLQIFRISIKRNPSREVAEIKSLFGVK